MLYIFQLQRIRQLVILNQLDESRALQPSVFLLVVDKNGIGLQSERAVLAHRIGVELLIIRQMAYHPIARSCADRMEINIEF